MGDDAEGVEVKGNTMKAAYVTYDPSPTENGCGHYCTHGGATCLNGAIALDVLRVRFRGRAPILDISGMSWGDIASRPNNAGADWWIGKGACEVENSGPMRDPPATPADFDNDAVCPRHDPRDHQEW